MKYSNKIDQLIVTIDPGKSGGIAYFKNNQIKAVKMPGSIPEINQFLKYLVETYGETILFIEKVQAYRGKEDDVPGKKFGINKMLANYNQLLTIIQLSGIPFVEVYPISWQSTLNLRIYKDKRTKTERKNSYKDYAQQCFPELKVTLATSDALCLVQFALVKFKRDRDWIHERLVDPKKSGFF
jgi:hypothetical protein